MGKYLNDFSINDQPPGFDKWWHSWGYGPTSPSNENGTIRQQGTYRATYLKSPRRSSS